MPDRFSIICTVRNRVHLIRRCVDSVLGQDDPDVEFVVQDGASTDGTADVLREYGDRLSLRSEPDDGAGDGLFRALRRATGTCWGSCMSDEVLVPDAVSWARRTLATHPDLGAIYGFVDGVDDRGAVLSRNDAGEFDVEKLLTYDQLPAFQATFFRMASYRQVGLWDYTGGGELDLWFRFAARFSVRRFPKLVGQYGMGRTTLSNQLAVYESERPFRLETIRRLFNDDEAGRRFRHLEQRAYAGYYSKYAGMFVRNADWTRAAESVASARRHWPAFADIPVERAAAAVEDLVARLSRPAGAATGVPGLDEHLRSPSPASVRALLEWPADEGDRLRALWLRTVVERAFNVWRLLPALGLRRVAVFGGEGWGLAIARDLADAGVECVAVIENNQSARDSRMIAAPYYSTAEFAAATPAVDAVLCSLQGDHDRDVAPSLQAAIGDVPVISWKTLVAALSRDVSDPRWPAAAIDPGAAPATPRRKEP